MNARDNLLARVRSALGREPGDRVPPAPPVRLAAPGNSDRLARFSAAVTLLGGTVVEVASVDQAKAEVQSRIAGGTFVASSAPILQTMGLAQEFSRDACAQAEVGVTSAAYALADTGSLVFLSAQESRLISLLPPRHIAVIERAKILSSLDELLGVVADPGAESSAMVIVTGPSRTADIEMRLVRGVHGPGEITVIVVA